MQRTKLIQFKSVVIASGILAVSAAGFTESASAQTNATPDTTAITLREALAFALERNPGLSAFPYHVRALEAHKLQASLRPNPSLGVVVENILGTGTVRAARGAETTLSLSQLVELGGKRLARVEVSQKQLDTAAIDYEVARIDVLARTAVEFANVLAGQELMNLARERKLLADEITATVNQLVDSGKVSPVEALRARSTGANARINLELARRGLAAARARLAGAWGGGAPRLAQAGGDLMELPTVPSEADLTEKVSKSPELRRWMAALAERHAEVALAEARRSPDLTLIGGIRELSGPNDRGLVVGFSIPLNVFDRKQGDRAAARQRAQETKVQTKGAEARALTELRVVYQRLMSARFEADTLASDVLPVAEETMQAISEGYRSGKFGYLDLLEAQRALFRARERRLLALLSARLAMVELERLAGEAATPPLPQP